MTDAAYPGESRAQSGVPGTTVAAGEEGIGVGKQSDVDAFQRRQSTGLAQPAGVGKQTLVETLQRQQSIAGAGPAGQQHAPTPSSSSSMAVFAASLVPQRFHVNGEVMLDGAWRTSQAISVVALPGVGPPAAAVPPSLRWRLLDRLGEMRASGTVVWAPMAPAPPPITTTIDQPGRWLVDIEVLERGKPLATLDVPIMARAAADTGADLPKVLAGSDLARSAAAMTDKQLGDQLGALCAQMGQHTLGQLKPDDPMYRKMAHAIEELQWQQHQRGAPGEAPVPQLDRSFDLSTPARRAQIQQAVDQLIARFGVQGAKDQLHTVIFGFRQGSRAQTAQSNAKFAEIEGALAAEFELRREDCEMFVARFDDHGRAIALGLLAESEVRLKAELRHYGLKPSPGGAGSVSGHGPAGADIAALNDAIEHGKRIRGAHDRLVQAAESHGPNRTAGVETARQELEAIKTIAIAKHPMLQMFLDPAAHQGMAMPGGAQVPGALDIGNFSTGAFAQLMGWQLNKKLSDLRATRQNLREGSLSIFNVPKVVELTKAALHVAPGSVHDGAVNEHAARMHTSHDSGVLALFAVALGLLLALPSGGTSLVAAGIATAGEVTLLAADLYLLGKDLSQRNVYRAATNTNISVADALLAEEPDAGPLILRILGVIGPLTGIAGVGRRVNDVAQVARAREGIEAVRAVRRAAVSHAATDPAVVAAVDRLRPIAREAGMTDDEIDALVRTAARKGSAGAARATVGVTDATVPGGEVHPPGPSGAQVPGPISAERTHDVAAFGNAPKNDRSPRPEPRYQQDPPLRSIERPVGLLGSEHKLVLREHRNGTVALYLCSTCANVRAEIEAVLHATPSKGPTRSMRTRLESLHAKVVELEHEVEQSKLAHTLALPRLNQIAAHLRDISQKFPSANKLCMFCAFEAGIDYDLLAHQLGFEKTNFRSHGQSVYKSGKVYITPDVDRHVGGVWKRAIGSHENLRPAKREGTYNEDLTDRLGD